MCSCDEPGFVRYDSEATEYPMAKDRKLAEAIEAFSSLKGIGRWTAEMILISSMNRMDAFAFDDVGIHRGIRMVYHHRNVTREMFEKYRRRFSPYGTVASLYFWAVSHMDVPGYDKDYAPKKRKK